MSKAKLIVARFRAVPFIMALCYLAQMALLAVMPDIYTRIVAQLVCTCPVLCVLVFWAGKPLGYCWAWKIECFLPCLPDLAIIANHMGWYTKPHLWITATALLFVGSIINGYRVYFKN